MNCLTCTYSHVAESDDDGHFIIECRRYPPQIFVFEGKIQQAFPEMQSDDVCGEWQGE